MIRVRLICGGSGWSDLLHEVQRGAGAGGFVWGCGVEVVSGGGGCGLESGEPAGAGGGVGLLACDLQGVLQDIQSVAQVAGARHAARPPLLRRPSSGRSILTWLRLYV